jgi:hypothetical protein
VVPPDWPSDSSRDWLWPAGLYWNGSGTLGCRECDQPGAARAGSSTTVWNKKSDYIFTTRTRRWCVVGPREYSDHAPLIYSMNIS